MSRDPLHTPKILFLEDQDFDPSGSLKLSNNNLKTIICLIQGNFCHYCTSFKPMYRQLVEQDPDGCIFTTIQVDGQQGEQALRSQERMTRILGFPMGGVPTVVKFRNGKVVGVYNGSRENMNEFMNWIHS